MHQARGDPRAPRREVWNRKTSPGYSQSSCRARSVFQAFLRGHSHLKPCWSRGSQALFAGTVHTLYFKYTSRQDVDLEGKRGNIFIFGLRKQRDTWRGCISLGEAALCVAEIEFDHCWRQTERPRLDGRAGRWLLLSPDILNTLLLPACAMWVLWQMESMGSGERLAGSSKGCL